MTRRARVAGIALLLAALAAGAAWVLVRPRLGAVERGRRLADANGCFGCHGPGGATGFVDGDEDVTVPAFSHDDVTAYSKTADEIREWILDGAPTRIREQREPEDPGLLVMPAFRGRLSDAEADDLVAYVRAVSDFDPPPPGEAGAGREVAHRLGCFACHGPQGRGALPNRGSFKGYVPPWDGEDYADLVRDDAELHAWILDGAPQRLRDNPVARYFLERQNVKMPAYRGRITDAELQQVTAYVRWLRTPR